MKRKWWIPVIIGASALLLAIIAIIIVIKINSSPQNKALKFAKQRGAINPTIKEEIVLTDKETHAIFYTGDDYEWQTESFKDNFVSCTKYVIASENYPDYNQYHIHCHKSTAVDNTPGVIDAFTDDLLQREFEEVFVKEHKDVFKGFENDWYVTVRKEEEIEEIDNLLRDFGFFIEDNHLTRVRLNGAGLQDDRYFVVKLLPSRGDPEELPVWEANFSELGNDAQSYYRLMLENYEVKNGLIYPITDEKTKE